MNIQENFAKIVPESLNNIYRELADAVKNTIKNQEDQEKLILLIQSLTKLVKGNNSDEKIIEWPARIAKIAVTELGLGISSVFACFIYAMRKTFGSDVVDFKLFGGQILPIVDGLKSLSEIKVKRIKPDEIFTEEIKNKRAKVKAKEQLATQTSNYIQLMLTLADDARSILLKLAIILDRMRNPAQDESDESMQLAEMVSVIYAPIAHRLGLYAIKTEMEELSMKRLHSEMYKFIAKKLAETKDSRNKFIDDFINPIKEELRKQNFVFEIKGRPKSIFSIWNKMQKQNVEFEGIYDIFAIRIILDSNFQDIKEEKSECWKVYSTLTDAYQTNPKRLRDWISAPKASGYESLHTTVLGPGGRWVEVQIRTRRMDEIAEKGQAAHWKYKESNDAKEENSWLTNIRDILENAKLIEVEEDDVYKKQLYSNDIFIFTPNGDLRRLLRGATILDFAYEIHSDLGDKCAGGIVNGKSVTIKEILKNGDMVEIITSNNQKPSEGWLKIAITPKAQSRIKKYVREAKYSKAEMGKDMILYKFNQLKVDFFEETITKLRVFLGEKTTLDMYQAFGEGKYDVSIIKTIFEPDTPKQDKLHTSLKNFDIEKIIHPEEEKINNKDLFVIDNTVGKLDYEIAQCCKPVFGDVVFGFITIGRGTRIHRVSCPNANDLLSKYPYRIVKARWANRQMDNMFEVNLSFTSIDSLGIVSYISEVIMKDKNCKLRTINVNPKDGLAQGVVGIYVTNTRVIDTIIRKIKEIKGVMSVNRTN